MPIQKHSPYDKYAKLLPPFLSVLGDSVTEAAKIVDGRVPGHEFKSEGCFVSSFCIIAFQDCMVRLEHQV